MNNTSTFFLSFFITVFIFVVSTANPVLAALSCSVVPATSCTSPSVIVLRMSAASNAHAELPSQSNSAYDNNVICCGGVSGLGNSCSGTYATAVKLSSVTNAHSETNTQSTYSGNDACISIYSGSISVGYGFGTNGCSNAGYETTLGSMSATTSAHLGDVNAYNTKICGSASLPSLTFTTDSASQSFPAATPGVLVATSSILTANTTYLGGFNVSIQRSNSSATMSLNTDSAVLIPDKTDWISPGATTTSGNSSASTTQPFTLQFRVKQTNTDVASYSSAWWGSNDNSASALFAGISSTSQMIINHSTPAGSGSSAYVLYNLNLPATQKTGIYSGSIIYTASINP